MCKDLNPSCDSCVCVMDFYAIRGILCIVTLDSFLGGRGGGSSRIITRPIIWGKKNAIFTWL